MTESILLEHEYTRGICHGQHEVAVDSMVRIHFLMGMPITEAAELIPCVQADRPQLIREAEEKCVLQPLRWDQEEQEALSWPMFVKSRIQSDELVAELMSVPVFEWIVNRMQSSLQKELVALDRSLAKHNGSAEETFEAEELSFIQENMLKYYPTVRTYYPELTTEQIARELTSGIIGFELLPDLSSYRPEPPSWRLEKAFAAGVRDGAFQMAQNITLRIVRRLGLSPAAASGLVDYRDVSRKALALSAAEACQPGNPALVNHLVTQEYRTILDRCGMNEVVSSMLTQTIVQCMICTVLGYCEIMIILAGEQQVSADAVLKAAGDPDVARFFLDAAELCYTQKRMSVIDLLEQVLGTVVGYNIQWYQWYLKDQ